MLAELIIAMGILTVGFLALLGTIPTSMSSVDSARDLLNMTNIAKEKIEYVRSKSFDTVITTSSHVFSPSICNYDVVTYSVINGISQTKTYHCDIGIYGYKNGISQSSLTTSTDKRVVVTVYDVNKPYHSIKIETAIAKQKK